MGIIDKAKDKVKEKALEALDKAKPETARMAYESDCTNFYFYQMDKLNEKPVIVKGKFIDISENKIQFSGDVFDEKLRGHIKLTEQTFFVDENSKVYTINKNTASESAEVVKAGMTLFKNEKAYLTTDATYTERLLTIN